MDRDHGLASVSIERREAASWAALWWMAVTAAAAITQLIYSAQA